MNQHALRWPVGMALVIFVALFVISITAADFCYLGPSKVLTQRAEGNEYAGYYLSGCVGDNPLGEEVNNVAASVSNLTTVTTALDALPACGNSKRCVTASVDWPRYCFLGCAAPG